MKWQYIEYAQTFQIPEKGESLEMAKQKVRWKEHGSNAKGI